MKNSLCAHCDKCEEVAYSGFLCGITGYLEDKVIEEGCESFKNDKDEFEKELHERYGEWEK